MLQRTVFINKTQDATTNTDATTNAEEYYQPTLQELLIVESSIIFFTRERLFMLFVWLHFFMFFY